MSTSVRAAAVVVACAIAVTATPAIAQTQAGPDARQARTAAASKEPVARVMAPAPAVEDIALVDQHGRATTLREAVASDKPVLLNFIFTTCTTICPIMTAGFSQFQDRLGQDRDRVRLVSISIDPETDTVDVLRAYAERHGAGPNWLFFTGTSEAVEAAQRAFGAFRGDPLSHAPVTYFRRAPGSAWEQLDGLPSAAALLRMYRGDRSAGH